MPCGAVVAHLQSNSSIATSTVDSIICEQRVWCTAQSSDRCKAQSSARHKCGIVQVNNGAQHKRHKIVDWCTVYSNMHCAAQNRVHGAHVLLSCRAASTGNQEGDRVLSSGTTLSINGLKTLHSSTEVQRKNHWCAAHFEAEKWLKGACVKNS